jgi:hypothetical protein
MAVMSPDLSQSKIDGKRFAASSGTCFGPALYDALHRRYTVQVTAQICLCNERIGCN